MKRTSVHSARQHSVQAAVPRTRHRGFTLIELLVVIAISAVLLSLAVPSFQDAMLSNKLASYANNFSGSVQLARSEAIKRNVPSTICRSSSGTSCVTSGNFQQGWIVFKDANGDGTVDSDDTVLQYQQALSTDYSFTSGTADTLVFQPSGAGSTAATLILCRALPNPGSKKRTIKLWATGRVTVTPATATSCP